MATKDTTFEEAVEPVLVIERIFDAPRELVFKAWTEPERVKRWWGPKGFTAPACKIDLRQGGRYLFCMRSPEGQDYWSTGVYREIAAPQRLVMTDSFADAEGNVVSAAYYGMTDEWPLEMLVSLTFEPQADKTKMTLTHAAPEAIGDMDRRNMEQGWNESLDKLADYLVEAMNDTTDAGC